MIYLSFFDIDERVIKASEKAINVLGGSIEGINNFILPGTEIKRHIILIKKN